MAKIKIDLPEAIIFSAEIPIRIGDINYGNHVGNDAFISLIHEARMQWLAKHKMTELKVAGTGLIMAGLSIEFNAESLYGDVVLVDIIAGEISGVRFDLYYRLSTTRDNKTIILAKALTAMVSYDYDNGKVISIPEVLLGILSSKK